MVAPHPAPKDSPPVGKMQRVLSNLGLLIGGKSVSGVLGLAYLALAVRALGVEVFGHLIIVHTVVELTKTVVKFQSWQPILRYGTSALEEGRHSDLRRLVLFSAKLDLASAIVGTIGAATALWFFSPLLGVPESATPAATLYALSLLFMITATPTGLLRLFDRFKLLILEDNVESLVRLIGCAILYVAGGGLKEFLLVWGISAVAGALTSVGLTWREAHRRGLIRRSAQHDTRPLNTVFPGIWRFVWSTNANSSLSLLTNHVATLVVGAFIGSTQAALFRIARQVAEASAKPVKLMTAAIYPEFARFVAQNHMEGLRAFLGRALRLSAMGAGLCALFLYFAGPWILRLIGGAEVADAFPTMLLLGLASLIGVGTFALEPALISIGRASLALRIRVASAVLYLPALAALVPMAGIEGAGIAAVGAAIVIALMQSQSVLSCFRTRHAPCIGVN